MSKRAGAVSADTREAILQAARDEFSEFGFRGSSLRRISSKAGVTTGAVYFFFSGKDDLFETVLSGVTGPFLDFMNGHYAGERDPDREQAAEQVADFAISLTLIDFYFQNRQTWDILLHHQNHPAVEKFLTAFVEQSTDHYCCRLQAAQGQQPRETPIDRFAIQQFVHMQVDTMLNLISCDFSQQEMIGHARTMTKMLQAAFQALLSE